jgi:DNA-binding transcriptional regulator LsrR (DeoR family)
MIDGEASLATRAAWLYFAAGLRQSEVADRLNIQSTKAHRLIARASRESMIRVFVEGSVAECVALENALTQRFSLALCRVAPDLGDRELPLKALALEGASFLRQILEHGEDQVIGVGYGQTLAAVVEQLPQTSAQEVVALKHMGACAHMLGHFFSEDGSLLNTDLSARAISMTAADLKKHRIVAIGGGLAKVTALRAVLRSRMLHGLIIDEATAQALVADGPETTSSGAKTKSRTCKARKQGGLNV